MSHVKVPWEMAWETVTAFGTVVIALATLFGLWGVFVSWLGYKLSSKIFLDGVNKQTEEAKRQREVAEERLHKEQRSRAVDLLVVWAKTVTKEMILARRIANDLDAAGAGALVNFEACSIKENARAHVDLLFKNRSRVATAGRIQLDVAEVIELRCFITQYLNLLEAIMLAWHHDSADREMLASEFRYFVLGSGDMKLVREAFDRADEVESDKTRAAYPAISAFIAYMSKMA